MAESSGQILDRIISEVNEELAAIGNESHIPDRYGMQYCAIVATRYAQAVSGIEAETTQSTINESK